MIRVVIADDDPMVRLGLRTIIDHEDDLNVVGEAEDGEEAVRLVGELDPDLVLMDIRMPKRDGLDATREITQRSERPRVVILTTFELDEYVYEAMRAGATGFLLKRVPPAELLDAVRLAVNGESLIFPALTRSLVEHAGKKAQDTERRLETLTTRENEVLNLLAGGKSNSEIAEALFIGSETVKTHVANVLMKLGARDRVQAVIYAYETSFVNPSSTDE
jgi:DNA-binding NarL/FixJ family response regulator